jgi:hypothetical protein
VGPVAALEVAEAGVEGEVVAEAGSAGAVRAEEDSGVPVAVSLPPGARHGVPAWGLARVRVGGHNSARAAVDRAREPAERVGVPGQVDLGRELPPVVVGRHPVN